MIILNDKLNSTELYNIISASRLTTYKNDLSIYIWNAKLCENFFLLLQNLEVALRNSIYNGFKKHFLEEDFFYLYESNLKNRYLGKKEFHSRECWKMLCAVKHNLSKQEIKVTDDKIISELNFGFWTKVLEEKRYSDIWRKVFIDVFPNKPINSIDNTKIEVVKTINELRKFRNRIFHFEPIFNKNPEKYHENILQSIKWINNSLYLITKAFDEFDTIFNDRKNIEKKLINLLKDENESINNNISL